jgi:hypothetical protein
MRFRFYILLFSTTFLVFSTVGLATIQDRLSSHKMDFSTKVWSQFQNVTIHEGDITVKNNETLVIEDCQFNLTGKLIIKNEAEVIIRNARFISNWNLSEEIDYLDRIPFRTSHVIVENQAKLTVLDSELIFSAALYPWHGESHHLIIHDQATLNMTKSRITYVNGVGDCIWASDNSKLWVEDAIISTFNPRNQLGPYPQYPKNGLLISEQSQVKVQNSTIDEIFLGSYLDEILLETYNVEKMSTTNVTLSSSKIEWFVISNDNSSASIVTSNLSKVTIYGPNSNVRLANVTLDELTIGGNSSMWMIDSIAEAVIASQNPKVWLTNASVKRLVAYGNSKVWLHNSAIKQIPYTHGIWVVWDWPLFGQVSVPYDLAPNVVPVIALTITLIAIIATLFLRRRKRRVETTEEAISLNKCARTLSK